MKDCKWIVYTLSHSLVYTGWFVIGSNNGSALNSLFNNQRVDVSVSQWGRGGGYRLTSWCNIVISLFVYKCPISSFYFLNLISTYTHFYARTVFVFFFVFIFIFIFIYVWTNYFKSYNIYCLLLFHHVLFFFFDIIYRGSIIITNQTLVFFFFFDDV